MNRDKEIQKEEEKEVFSLLNKKRVSLLELHKLNQKQLQLFLSYRELEEQLSQRKYPSVSQSLSEKIFGNSPQKKIEDTDKTSWE